MGAIQMNAINESAQAEMCRSPLEEIHKRDGATLGERDGCIVPLRYGDANAEYAAVRVGNGAGLIDLSSRGRIKLHGSEVVQFLNGLITNDMKTLAAGAWMHAIFPNVQGRMIAAVRVLRPSEADVFYISTEAASYIPALKTVERFRFAGDFHVTDLTHSGTAFSVQGAKAADIIRAVLGDAAADIKRFGVAAIEWHDTQLIVLRATHTSEDGFDLILDNGAASALWQELKNAGGRPVGFEAFDVLRLEAGIPRFGVDMNETTVVLETGLDAAISYTKGCYIGQEIIARIHWRGHVAKRLSGLIFEDRVDDARESKIKTNDGAKEIGRITSTVFSPHLDKTIALGYVRYEYLAAGTEVLIVRDDEKLSSARVAELPFVRGSWNER
ncbi:MAG: glycine cleavage system aminomethyltransferase GcvT [Pyrinomonadaceae bacterium]